MLMNNMLTIGKVKEMRMDSDEECNVFLDCGLPFACRSLHLILVDGSMATITFHLSNEEALNLWNQRQSKEAAK